MIPTTSNSNEKRVIIFDWDDTICPSSFVDQWKFETFKDLPLHFQNLCLDVGRCAEKCLSAASQHGEVIIITNSDDGWVKFSAERYVPNLLPCLERYRIVSARTRYERFYPNQPLCWKAAAFAHEVNEIYSCNEQRSDVPTDYEESMNDDDDGLEVVNVAPADDSSTESCFSAKLGRKTQDNDSSQMKAKREVISFGDSMEERTAVKIVANQLNALPKSVMFIGTPSPAQIIGQLLMLTNNMSFVCQTGSSLDLEISPHQAQKSADAFLRKEKPLRISQSMIATPATHQCHSRID